MAAALAGAAEVPDLVLHGIRPNGDEVEIFVHSETFAPEKCLCRAPGLAVTLRVGG
jgi:hypothetical protein